MAALLYVHIEILFCEITGVTLICTRDYDVRKNSEINITVIAFLYCEENNFLMWSSSTVTELIVNKHFKCVKLIFITVQNLNLQ
jgi:hypothetical protein